MANVKARNDVESDRLLSINWKPEQVSKDALQRQAVATNMAVPVQSADMLAQADAAAEQAMDAALDATEQPTVVLKIDEVFQHITAYRAIVENAIPEQTLLAQSLRAQANAVFNQAFLNVQARYGYDRVYVDAPAAQDDCAAAAEDITEVLIHEVLRLQRILK